MCTNHLTTKAALEIAAARKALRLTVDGPTGHVGYEIRGGDRLIFRHESTLADRETALLSLEHVLSKSVGASREFDGDLAHGDVAKLLAALADRDDVRAYDFLA